MSKSILIRALLAAALTSGSHQIRAQDLALDYISELQTDFRNAYAWANFLSLSAQLQVGKSLSLQCQTISVASTSSEPIIDDLQGYSNIQEAPLPLAVAVLGPEASFGPASIFLGIRNVNVDYFTSPVTSFFINSSCGIFPTLSANCDIANYPLSSWCLHAKADLGRFVIQTSLYDGQGHRRILGHDNIFAFRPAKTGIFSITSAEYLNNGSNYILGCAVYYGVRDSDADGIKDLAPSSPPSPKKVTVAPWINLEHKLTSRLALMLQASLATDPAACRSYLALGANLTLPHLSLGILANHARYLDASESVLELTCHIPLTSQICIQPDFQLIGRKGSVTPVGILRLALSI